MKRILACLAVAALAAPAFAQQASTLQELTTKGMVMEAGGMEIDVTYKPDGTFTAMDGQVTGKWRIEGEKLCLVELCAGRRMHDLPGWQEIRRSFELTGARNGDHQDQAGSADKERPRRTVEKRLHLGCGRFCLRASWGRSQRLPESLALRGEISSERTIDSRMRFAYSKMTAKLRHQPVMQVALRFVTARRSTPRLWRGRPKCDPGHCFHRAGATPWLSASSSFEQRPSQPGPDQGPLVRRHPAKLSLERLGSAFA
jgi:hypothetical protein